MTTKATLTASGIVGTPRSQRRRIRAGRCPSASCVALAVGPRSKHSESGAGAASEQVRKLERADQDGSNIGKWEIFPNMASGVCERISPAGSGLVNFINNEQLKAGMGSVAPENPNVKPSASSAAASLVTDSVSANP